MRWSLLYILIIILLSSFVLSHEETSSLMNLDLELSSIAVKIVLFSFIMIIIITAISIIYKKQLKKYKKLLYIATLVITVIATLFIAGSTIYVNILSETKGPVHWHADFEIYNCGEDIDLLDSTGLSNRIGSSKLHGHDDSRIHVEGVVTEKNEVNLHGFFEAIGGSLSKDQLIVPTNNGLVSIKNNEFCNGKPAKLQVFLYRITNPSESRNTGFIYSNEKLENFPDYILSPYQNVPPGDCIIIEFDQEKTSTEHICESYKVAIQNGDLIGS